MGNEGFFRRWARLKTETGSQESEAGGADAPAAALPVPVRPVPVCPASVPTPAQVATPQPAVSAPAPVLTLEDAAGLTAESNYADFVGKGVDKAVQRLAMKKLFSDPHFNVMDGLDIYISDYNKASPVSPVMLASLKQAQSFLAPAQIFAEPNVATADMARDATPHQNDLAQPEAASEHCAYAGGAAPCAPLRDDASDPPADVPRSAGADAVSAPTQNPAGTGTAAPAPTQGNE